MEGAPASLSASSRPQLSAPFNRSSLDALMDERGIDVLLITSKHNIQYFLGGYRYFFYSYMDAHGLSRYLPIVIYVKGELGAAAYVGSPMEIYEKEHGKFWVAETYFDNMTVEQFASAAAGHLKRLGRTSGRIGLEMDFLPHSALVVLNKALPQAEFVNANFLLEVFRAVKTPKELEALRIASEKVVDSMLAVIAGHGEGSKKSELVDALMREEVARGLFFEYALINMGSSFNRAPSEQVWKKGEVLAIDSGGNYRGYIGDLCRMAILGDPDQELQDLLGEVDAIQQAARKPIRAGRLGREIFESADKVVEASPFKSRLEFVAHGMGIVGHEAPWLTDRASVPYEAYHADRPLQAGMVLSIETTLLHSRGFIKLEDTVAVTEGGWEAFADYGRGWNRAGREAAAA